jgi:hypothetical protein
MQTAGSTNCGNGSGSDEMAGGALQRSRRAAHLPRKRADSNLVPGEIPPPRSKRKQEAEGTRTPIADLTWYAATRHSFVSRNLSRGASLDQVADAVGHSTPAVTKRHYAHYIRKDFSPHLREGLGLTGGAGEGAKVIPLDGIRTGSPEAPAPTQESRPLEAASARRITGEYRADDTPTAPLCSDHVLPPLSTVRLRPCTSTHVNWATSR